jgi:hypothetical protein
MTTEKIRLFIICVEALIIALLLVALHVQHLNNKHK